jgi:actin related protein 2/3 complex subunit 3
MKELIYNLSGVEDVIDETLGFFRANVLFRNFDVRGGADRTLIYLTLYAVQCLVKCEKIEDKPTAVREMKNLATKQFLCPGDPGWPLGGLFPSPKSKAESGASITRMYRSIKLLPLSTIFN